MGGYPLLIVGGSQLGIIEPLYYDKNMGWM